MEYELTLLERLTLLQALPAQGNFATIKIVRKLREDLSLSEKEHKEYNVVLEGDRIRWDLKKEKPKKVDIGPTSLGIIQKALKGLNDKEQLKDEHITVYERFVGDGGS